MSLSDVNVRDAEAEGIDTVRQDLWLNCKRNVSFRYKH